MRFWRDRSEPRCTGLRGRVSVREGRWPERSSQSGFQPFSFLGIRRLFGFFVTMVLTGYSSYSIAQNAAAEVFITDYNRFPVIAEWRFKEDVPAHIVSSLHWLSDDEIIVASDPAMRQSNIPATAVVVWRLSNNQKARHMTGKVFCADPITRQVQISVEPRYMALINDGIPALEGVWQENGKYLRSYMRYAGSSDPSRAMHINRYTCKRLPGNANDLLPGSAVFPLRDGHGFLHHPLRALTQRVGEAQRLFFRSQSSEKDIAIEFREPEFSNTRTTFYPFSEKYAIQGPMILSNDFQPKLSRPFRLMSVDGRIEVIQPPAAMWARARTHGIQPQLSKIGMLWHWSASNPDDLVNGTYLQEGDTFTRFTRSNLTVSPGGCRAYDYDFKEGSIKVLELCKEKLTPVASAPSAPPAYSQLAWRAIAESTPCAIERAAIEANGIRLTFNGKMFWYFYASEGREGMIGVGGVKEIILDVNGRFKDVVETQDLLLEFGKSLRLSESHSGCTLAAMLRNNRPVLRINSSFCTNLLPVPCMPDANEFVFRD